jgi:hypothetical protein
LLGNEVDEGGLKSPGVGENGRGAEDGAEVILQANQWRLESPCGLQELLGARHSHVRRGLRPEFNTSSEAVLTVVHDWYRCLKMGEQVHQQRVNGVNSSGVREHVPWVAANDGRSLKAALGRERSKLEVRRADSWMRYLHILSNRIKHIVRSLQAEGSAHDDTDDSPKGRFRSPGAEQDAEMKKHGVQIWQDVRVIIESRDRCRLARVE